jgi:uncharacterized protein (TIGR02722 family)
MKTLRNGMLLALPLLMPLAAGCRSVEYGDAEETETLTVDFGSTDLQTLAGGMVESLIASPQLNYLANDAKGEDMRIVAYMGGVNNRTSEHIDTTGITDSIRVQMLKSGKFRWAAGDQAQEEISDQVRFQQGSGRVDPAWAQSFGKQIGAELILYGNLRSIDKSYKGKRDLYYQFILEAVRVETGEIIWGEEQEIRKKEKKGLFS